MNKNNKFEIGASSKCKCGWQENYETEDKSTDAWNVRVK